MTLKENYNSTLSGSAPPDFNDLLKSKEYLLRKIRLVKMPRMYHTFFLLHELITSLFERPCDEMGVFKIINLNLTTKINSNRNNRGYIVNNNNDTKIMFKNIKIYVTS